MLHDLRGIALVVAASLCGLATLPACLSDSRIPVNADVTCSSTDDCPRGYVCQEARCEDPHGNLPPLVTITAPARASGDIEVDATLIDPNADTLALSASLQIGNAAVACTVSPATAHASANGAKVHVTVTPPPQSSLGAGTFPVNATLHVVAKDATRAATADAPLLYGNDAPSIDALSVDTVSTFNSAEPFAGGVVDVRFVAQDSSGDAITVTKFRVLRDDGTAIDVPLDVHSFPNGGLTDVPTTAGGADVVLVWDTAPAAPLSEHVTVEVTIDDGFGGTTTATSPRFLLDDAPTVGDPQILASTGHALTVLNLAVPLDDPNCASGDETVSLAVTFSPDDAGGTGTFFAATPTSQSGSLTGIVATNALHLFGWDLVADAVGGTLPANVVVTTDHPEGELVPAQTNAAMLFTVTDTSGLSRGLQTSFLVGNDPPVVTAAPFANVERGPVPISFSIADSGSDPATVEIEFRKDANDTFRPIAVLAGVLDNLFTSTTPSTFLVIWNSLAPENDNDTTAPQGIGHALLPNAELRIRASDEPAPGVHHFSPWTTLAISLSNQTAPRIDPIFVGDQGGIRNGVVPIVYRAIDEESDPVDVAFEFSVDGARFRPCTEAPFPWSEGTLGLASAPLLSAAGGGPGGGGGAGGPGAGGGVVHTFLWDSTADMFAAEPSVRLRARVVDGQAVKATDDPFTIPTVTLLQPAQFNPLPAAGATGAFTLRSQASPSQFVSMHAGDVDHDGKADLVVTFNAGADHLQLLHGDGSGGYTTLFDHVIAGVGNDFQLVDVDGDGTLDVLTFFTGMLIKGPAYTTATPLIAACNNTNFSCNVEAADIDGDGAMDIVFIDESQTTRVVDVLFGAGVGPAYHVVDGGLALATGGELPVIGDVDGDGHPDLLVQLPGSFPSPVQTFLGAGGIPGGALGSPTFTPVGAPFQTKGSATALVDLDGDGKDDLVTNDDTAGILFALRGNGDGSFDVADAVESVTFPGNHPVISDVNGDGTPDVALGSATEQAVLVALSESGGKVGFVGAERVPVANVPLGIDGADIDGDGRPDLVAFVPAFGGGTSLLTSLLTGVTPAENGSSASAARAMVPGGVNSSTPIGLDVDRDGALDFFITTELGDVTVAHGALDGAVTTSWSADYGPPRSDFHCNNRATRAVDFDNNGVVDFATLPLINNGLSCTLEVWLGDKDADGIATGTFAESFSLPNSACADDLAAGDVDGDGFVDLVGPGANGTQNQLVVLHNNSGDGTFTSTTLTASALQFIGSYTLADFNGDGFSDLIVSEDQSGAGPGAIGHASIFPGSASGLATTPSSTIAYPLGAGALRVSDFDNDGALDVLCVPKIMNGGVDMTVLKGNVVAIGAAPTFSVHAAGTTLPSGQSFSVVLQDVDLDGHLDAAFVMPDPFSTNIFVFPGSPSGNATFLQPAQIATDKNRIALTTLDVTLDGAPDFVSADFFNGNLDAFLGRTSLPFASQTRALSQTGASGARAFGPDVAFVDDAGGSFTQKSAIGFRRVSGASDVLAGAPASYGLDGGGGDLATLLRSQRVLTGHARPITGAFFASGDVKLVRVPDPLVADETRLALEPRFGPLAPAAIGVAANGGVATFARTGMSLAGNTKQRGVVVDVPLLAGHTPTGNVRVLLGVPRWRTAAEVASDPLSSSPNASQFLPKRNGKDVVDVRYDWLDVPAGSIADPNATGKRFEVDTAHKTIHVLTDELGVIEAFDGT